MSILALLASVVIASTSGQFPPVGDGGDAGAICDRLAGAPNDPARSPIFPGVVTGGDIEGFAALDACRKAQAHEPRIARYRFQYARVLIWARQSAEAAPLLEKLVEEKYVAAFAALGEAYRRGDGVRKDRQRAYELLQEASRLGDPKGDLGLGYLFRLDDGPDEDYEASAKAFEKARAGGVAEATVQLGDAYAMGYGVRRDPVKALEFFREADAAGEADGADGVGLAYENGWGVDADLKEARKWYERAAKLGSAWGRLHLANLLMSNGGEDDATEAVRNYRAAAEASLDAGQLGLGNAYSEGRGVPKDARLAKDWFERAIANNNPQAMNNLGVLYLEGALSPDGKTSNREMGLPLYERAAALGNEVSMLNLGARLEDEAVAPHEPHKIVLWYQRAAFAGNVAAMARLGQIYLNDEYGYSDVALAFLWNRRAAEAGNKDGMVNLGWAYDVGLGVPSDKSKAFSWYREAALKGDANAMNNLGVMYVTGEGVPKNPRVGIEWYAKAIQANGSPLAHFNIAEVYRDGAGVEPSPSKAAQHLIAALEGGSSRAFKSLTNDARLWPSPVWKQLQEALARRGLYDGPADGRPLLPTRKAFIKLYLKGGGEL
ncbi:tetratricopeptide repeat protein [Rhizobium sp. FKL33]|uniref:tetratricopeptide repeat protein n=1 Tax=Rhizobium sp. FKL33 TaxID=2562307 RepID=UPI0010C0202C|nr:tetratricopeptide repeat protein [Rhizobium sp. FKL33]